MVAVIAFHAAAQTLAAAGVLERHAFRAGATDEFGPLGSAIGSLIETGGLALGLFFAFSGYLIGRPFVFAVVRGEPLPRLSSYARNRFLRIVPAFWVVFTLLVIIYGTRGASGWEIFSVYTFIEASNRTSYNLVFGQAWSLKAEVIFYLLVPITTWLLLRATRRLRQGSRLRTAIAIALPLLVAVIVIWVNTWALTGKWNPMLGFYPPSLALARLWYYVPAVVFYMFMPGLILAALETFVPSRAERFGTRHPRAAWGIPSLIALTGFMLLYSVQRFDLSSVQLGSTVIFFGIFGVIGGPLLLQWTTGGSWRWLDIRVFRWLGQRSYSIYLVHLAIVVELAPRFVRYFDPNYKRAFLAVVLVSIASSVLLGNILFRLVEAPFMNLKTFGWRSPARAAVWRRAALWIPSGRFFGGRQSAPAAAVTADATPTLADDPASETEVRPRRARLPEFLAGDPIRGVGVLAVITYHVAFYALFFAGSLERVNGSASFSPLGKAVGTLIETGGYVLALFFALSGYLISRPFVFAYVRGERRPRIWSYARNRILRIVPTLWFVVTVLLVIYGTRGASTEQVLNVYAFTESWVNNPLARIVGQAWSLRAEAFFYIIVPISVVLLVWLTSRLRLSQRMRALIAVGVPLAVAASVIYFFIYVGPDLGRTWVTARTSPLLVFYIFMPGVAFAAMETFFPDRVGHFAQRHARLAWVIPTALAVASFAVLYCNQWFDPRNPQLNAWLIFFGISGVLGACLLLQWGTGGCWRTLDNGVFRWLGQRSYSIYMVHLAIVVELAPRIERAFDNNYKQTALALLVAATAGSVAAGYVVFRLVEAPFMNLKTSGWRSSDRTALFRRAAWWLPARASERMSSRRPVHAAPSAEPLPDSAVGAEPSTTPIAPSS